MDPEFPAKCFYQNTVLLGNSTKDPEKFNLYVGLQHLAHQVAALLSKVERLEREIAALRR